MAGDDLPSLVLGDDTAERMGAAQTLPFVGLVEEDPADLRPRSFQDLDPLVVSGG